MNATWSDLLFVHLIILLWVGPLVPGVVGMIAAMAGSWQYTVGSTALYGAIKVLTDRFTCLPDDAQRALAVHLQRAYLQLIMTGPHGVFALGGFVSGMTSDHLPKNVVCAIDPNLIRYGWIQPLVPMMGVLSR